jgi:ribosomal protein S18 acetylase RimI-like enzyme
MIDYIEADEAWRLRIAQDWDETAARHMHLVDGFSILALSDGLPVGLISVYWKRLPPHLEPEVDAYIDILEVHRDFRRQGIARRLIACAMDRARAEGMTQIRAWSSEDKTEAIHLWKKLGFGLCPAVTYSNGQSVKGFFVVKPL